MGLWRGGGGVADGDLMVDKDLCGWLAWVLLEVEEELGGATADFVGRGDDAGDGGGDTAD